MDLWSEQPIRLQVTGNGISLDQVLKQPFARIGSHSRSDLVLRGTGVNRRHFYLHVVDSGIFCLDFKAETIAGRQAGYWLQPGQPVSIGPYQLLASLPQAEPGPTILDPEWNTKPLPGIFPVGNFKIDNRRKPKTVQYHFRKHLTTLGSSEGNSVTIRDGKLSDFHCVVYREGLDTWIVDLLSNWPVIHRRQPVDATKVSYESRVLLGNVVLQFGFRRKEIFERSLREKVFPNSTARADYSAQSALDPNAANPHAATLDSQTQTEKEAPDRGRGMSDKTEWPARSASAIVNPDHGHQNRDGIPQQTPPFQQETEATHSLSLAGTERLVIGQPAADRVNREMSTHFEVQQFATLEREIQLNEYSQELEQRAREMNVRLAQSEEQTGRLTRQLADRDNEIHELQVQQSHAADLVELAAARTRLANQDLELGELKPDLARLESTMLENEKELAGIRESLAQSEDQMGRLTRQLAARDKDFVELQVQLTEREVRLTEREVQLARRDEELQSLSENHQVCLVGLAGELQQLQESHAADQVELAAARTRLASQQLELGELKPDLERLESTILENVKELAGIRESLARAESQLDEAQRKLGTRDSELVELLEQLAKRDEELAAHDSGMQQKLENERQSRVLLEQEFHRLREEAEDVSKTLSADLQRVNVAATDQQQSDAATIAQLHLHLVSAESRNTTLAEQLKLAKKLPTTGSAANQQASKPDSDPGVEIVLQGNPKLEAYAAELQQREAELEVAEQQLNLARRSFETDLKVQLAQVSVLTNLKNLQREKQWFYRAWESLGRMFRGR